MFYLQLKIALRNLWRYRLHTGINVLGLAIGICACFVMIQLVRFDYSFDKFHPNAERIFRLYSSFSGEFSGVNSGVSVPLPLKMSDEVPGIAAISPLYYFGRMRIEVADKNSPRVFPDERGVVAVTPDYFKIFTAYEWLHGSPETALNKPYQVVLSEERAKRYFGTENVAEIIGREVIYRDSLPLTVTGIVANFTQNSDLIFEDFISLETARQTWLGDNISFDSWINTNSNYQAYVLLEEQVDREQLLTTIQSIYDKNRKSEKFSPTFNLQPLPDLHFNTELGVYNNNRTANRTTLFALLCIALIILMLAGINFVNLATAQAIQRSKEVGVRKVLGGTRASLIRQFLSETFILTSVAALTALFIGNVAFGWFAEFLPQQFSYSFFEADLLLYLLGIIVVVSLLAGLYPATVLSAYQPVVALKKQIKTSHNKLNINFLRKGLIVFQFTITLILITGTYLLSEQIHYILNKDLGFAQEAIIYTQMPWQKGEEKIAQFHHVLQQIPAIQQTSGHYAPPTSDNMNVNFYNLPREDELVEQKVYRKMIDESYIDLYELTLLAGRNVMPSDSSNQFIINQTLAQVMGYENPNDALNQTFSNEDETCIVIGVVEDFHHQTLQEAINPLIMTYDDFPDYLSYKFQPNTDGATIEKTLAQLATNWHNIYPEISFDYTFYDDFIAQQYDTERRTAKLLQTATFIAILISCLGLFGLVSFMVVQRTREIGVRKVLGASVTNIVGLLSKDFLWLVGIAILIGTPISYWLGQKWLADYAYAIEMKWWMFGLTAAVAIGIAFMTVSVQSIKAALVNPVESLKEE